MCTTICSEYGWLLLKYIFNSKSCCLSTLMKGGSLNSAWKSYDASIGFTCAKMISFVFLFEQKQHPSVENKVTGEFQLTSRNPSFSHEQCPCFRCPAEPVVEWDVLVRRVNWVRSVLPLIRCRCTGFECCGWYTRGNVSCTFPVFEERNWLWRRRSPSDRFHLRVRHWSIDRWMVPMTNVTHGRYHRLTWHCFSDPVANESSFYYCWSTSLLDNRYKLLVS